MHYKHMISLVKNLKCISRQNIHYYPDHWYKSYITSLKAVIIGKSLISAALDIYRILYFVFYDKILQIYWQHWVRKFYRHILSKYRHISKAPTAPSRHVLDCSYIINFVINLSFYTKPLFYLTKKSGEKYKYLKHEKRF